MLPGQIITEVVEVSVIYYLCCNGPFVRGPKTRPVQCLPALKKHGCLFQNGAKGRSTAAVHFSSSSLQNHGQDSHNFTVNVSTHRITLGAESVAQCTNKI